MLSPLLLGTMTNVTGWAMNSSPSNWLPFGIHASWRITIGTTGDRGHGILKWIAKRAIPVNRNVGKQSNTMRLGLVTDIHNDCASLRKALEVFRKHQVDQVVTIGDTCDAFAPPNGADEVASLLSSCGAVGVWGNHDFHLCRDVSDFCQNKFAATTCEFMRQMQPQLEIDGCYFSHKDASVDPRDVEQLWSFEDDARDLCARARAAFAANRHGRQFMGHYHCWWAATPTGPISWNGSESLTLMPHERYVVIIAGVFQGKCAVFDTATGVLDPLECSSP